MEGKAAAAPRTTASADRGETAEQPAATEQGAPARDERKAAIAASGREAALQGGSPGRGLPGFSDIKAARSGDEQPEEEEQAGTPKGKKKIFTVLEAEIAEAEKNSAYHQGAIARCEEVMTMAVQEYLRVLPENTRKKKKLPAWGAPCSPKKQHRVVGFAEVDVNAGVRRVTQREALKSAAKDLLLHKERGHGCAIVCASLYAQAQKEEEAMKTPPTGAGRKGASRKGEGEKVSPPPPPTKPRSGERGAGGDGIDDGLGSEADAAAVKQMQEALGISSAAPGADDVQGRAAVAAAVAEISAEIHDQMEAQRGTKRLAVSERSPAVKESARKLLQQWKQERTAARDDDVTRTNLELKFQDAQQTRGGARGAAGGLADAIAGARTPNPAADKARAEKARREEKAKRKKRAESEGGEGNNDGSPTGEIVIIDREGRDRAPSLKKQKRRGEGEGDRARSASEDARRERSKEDAERIGRLEA